MVVFFETVDKAADPRWHEQDCVSLQMDAELFSCRILTRAYCRTVQRFKSARPGKPHLSGARHDF
jgi:hypothetical protein